MTVMRLALLLAALLAGPAVYAAPRTCPEARQSCEQSCRKNNVTNCVNPGCGYFEKSCRWTGHWHGPPGDFYGLRTTQRRDGGGK
jgi:hypothetical protein